MGTLAAIDLGIKILDLTIAGTAGLQEMSALRERLAQMQAEGRDPTAEEWKELNDSVDQLSADLSAADARLNGGNAA